MTSPLEALSGRCREISLRRPRLVGIYFLIQCDEIVYIGQSQDVETRIDTHRVQQDKSFERALYFEVDANRLDDYEGALIRALRPQHNEASPANRGADAEVLEALGLPASSAGPTFRKKRTASSDIGQRIRSRRAQARITQHELASRIGVTSAAVAQWEVGTAEPKHSRVSSIAAALGVSIAELLS